MFFRKLLCIGFVLLLFRANAAAVNHEDSLYKIDGVLISKTQLFTGKNATVSQVVKLSDDQFKTIRQEGFNLRLNHENWIKKSFNNTDSVNRELIIELTNPFLYDVKFFTVDSSAVGDSLITGASKPFTSRPILHPNFQYKITLPPLQQTDCFIQVNTGTVSSDLVLLVWDKEKRKDYQLTETKYLSYFLIINIVFLLLIGLAIFQTKQKYHWFYFLYILFGIAHIYTDLGMGFKNIWPQNTSFNNTAIYIFANGYLVFGVSFVRNYFETMKRTGQLDSILHALIIIGIISTAIEMLMVFFLPQLPLWLVIFNTCVFLLAGIMVFGTAAVCLRYRYLKKDTVWFLIGFLPHSIAISFLCFRVFGLFNNSKEAWFEHIVPFYIKTIHTPNFLLWSVLWELVIVFYLIMRRVKYIYESNNNMMLQLAQQRENSMRGLLADVEKERKRIAQELHDGTGVRLATLKMNLAILKDKIAESESGSTDINGLMHDVDKLHEEIRGISHNLMPKTLSKLGLYRAVGELVNQFKIASPKMKLNYFVKTTDNDFNEDAKINIYRIIQELLTNIVKHSQAKEVTLQLIKHHDSLMVSVEDDGIGFEMRESRQGLGLSSIESRVGVLNGTMSVDSSPGNGTFISLFLPLENLR